MSEIEIPFNKWSRDRLEQGQKTATTRTSRYGDPGDTFVVDGRKYELTHVIKVELEVVARHFWGVEGCNYPNQFCEVWKEIHPHKGYEPDWEVWLHLFTEQ